MLSRCHGKVLAVVLLLLFALQGCGGNVMVTPSVSSILATETSTPSPRPSATSTTTPDYVATQNSIETASINAIVATVQPVTLAEYPSPDEKWRAEVIRYECINYPYEDYAGIIAYEQLKLINLSDGYEKVVDDQRINCDGVGAYGFSGLYWSPNARYFYYNDSREGYPHGSCGNFIQLPIRRLDTITGNVIILDGGTLSPDKTKLATWRGSEIVILELDNGEVARVTPLRSDLSNGMIWWSGGSDSILYLQTEFDCAPDYGKFYLTKLDLTGLSQNLIAEYEIANTGFISTPSPAGVFVFFFYSPLVMNYDPSEWETRNGLQARELTSCSIYEQGPTDFNGPHNSETVQLGTIEYEVLSFPELSADLRISKAYLADQSLATEVGIPVFWVSAKPEEWDECKELAEEVLATLRFP